MKTVILCGGLGTRIRDASEVIPKPMLPIGGRPILWHIMKGYAHHGFDQFVLCLGYRGWQIKEFFLNYRTMNADVRVRLGENGPSAILTESQQERWDVILAETGEHSMTGARLVAVRRYLEGDDSFMLTYGDGVGNVDIRRLVEFHRSHGMIATVTAVRPAGRYGELVLEDSMVREFSEKPQTSQGYISGGFFVFDARRIWDYLDDDPGLHLEAEPMQRLVKDRQLAAYQHPGFWQPMDTRREFNQLNEMWGSGRAPWKIWR